jgi:hypothetical protein
MKMKRLNIMNTISKLHAGLRQTTQQLVTAGHDVVIVQTVPHWVEQHHWDLADCSVWEVLNGCNQTMPSSFYLTRSEDVRKAVEGSQARGAHIVDFLDVLCPGDSCRTYSGKYWIYRDENHISQETSLQLAPVWSERLPVAR